MERDILLFLLADQLKMNNPEQRVFSLAVFDSDKREQKISSVLVWRQKLHLFGGSGVTSVPHRGKL